MAQGEAARSPVFKASLRLGSPALERPIMFLMFGQRVVFPAENRGLWFWRLANGTLPWGRIWRQKVEQNRGEEKSTQYTVLSAGIPVFECDRGDKNGPFCCRKLSTGY